MKRENIYGSWNEKALTVVYLNADMSPGFQRKTLSRL
jgi:hypothetical protein